MTCTTHHICDCLQERMKKLEAVAEAAKDFLKEPLAYGAFGELSRKMKALEQEP